MRYLFCFALLLLPMARLQADASATAGTSVQPSPTPTVNYAEIPGIHTDKSFTPDRQYQLWPHVDTKEMQRLQAMKNVAIADARSEVEWEQGHIPGAVAVPLGDFDKAYAKNESKFKKARYIVVYCHGPGCHLSEMACKNFYDKGYRNIVNYYIGWPGWSQENLPSQDKEGKITVVSNALTPTPGVAASPLTTTVAH
jgi:rhodanese-related sulfurtransferase